MATQERVHEVTRQPSLPEAVDLPATREYADPAAAELDRSLCDAIDAADRLGSEYLATLLGFELGSHYVDA
jgi:hypothetical protein